MQTSPLRVVSALFLLATLVAVPGLAQWSEQYEAEKEETPETPSLEVDWKPPETAPEAFGSTPLMKAVSDGDVGRVRELLEAGADPTATDSAGSTAVFYMPPEGRTEATELVLDAGAAVDAKNDVGLTPLTVASLLGRTDMVKLFLDRPDGGADPSYRPPDGEPPLARALRKGHLETARVLLGALEDDGAELNPELRRATTLLYRQASMGDAEGVRLLLEHGVRPDPRVGKAGVFTGETPLLAAARLGHAEVARALLEHGASIEALDRDGKTPLILAAEGAAEGASEGDSEGASGGAAENGHLETVRALLEHGADIESTGGEKSRTTPLGFAAMSEDAEVVKLLLEHGAAVDVQNRSDVTPLMLAAFGEEPASVEHLLEAGASVDLENRDGNTALVFAVLLRREEATRLLLEAGSSTDVKTRIPEFGYVTPLHLAAGRGHHEITRLLLDHGARTGVYGQMEEIGRMTPLLMAARAGDAKTVRMLLEHGADPTLETDDGDTAFALARKRGHREVVAVFETLALLDAASAPPTQDAPAPSP